jgi:hypothetical protein
MSSIPTPDPAVRTFVARRLVAIGAALVTLTAPFVYAPYVGRGPVLCPWHGLAGLPCPGCGLTRAFCALAHLDVRAALALNALSLPLLVVLLVVPVVGALELARRHPYGWYRGLGSPGVARGCGATVMLYHLARVTYWCVQGTLVPVYVKTSWSYGLYQAIIR